MVSNTSIANKLRSSFDDIPGIIDLKNPVVVGLKLNYSVYP